VCVKCGLDCHDLVQHLQPLTLDDRTSYILQTAPQFDRHKCLLERLVLDPSEGNAWHADHIVPVADGGGKSFLPLKKLACVSRCTWSQLRILTMGVLLLYLRETMEDPQNWPSKMTLHIFWGSFIILRVQILWVVMVFEFSHAGGFEEV
jgi:hypothetical protein